MEDLTPRQIAESHGIAYGIRRCEVRRLGRTSKDLDLDPIAVEEPLEIRIEFGAPDRRAEKSISITMRTPGSDFDLAAGFLFTEGLIRNPKDILGIKHCGGIGSPPFSNVVRVNLSPRVEVNTQKLTRHFYTSSSCGVCGKASIEALKTESIFPLSMQNIQFKAEQIHELPAALRKSQGIFDATGGIHASALFSSDGTLVDVREDVGRHNALDKLIGHCFLKNLLPLDRHLLLVSGRASFELIQKASMAGLTVFAAVGAPSSLAVDLAKEVGMTLLGFVRENRFNIYSHESRVLFPGVEK